MLATRSRLQVHAKCGPSAPVCGSKRSSFSSQNSRWRMVSTSSVSDPFGTAAVRDRVLAAWTASPARFREDANAEQDLTHGAYRDRLLVELAQNAADAATRAGVPGALRLALVDGALVAANTGAPLDPAGAEALATLRASAKRDGDSVGRFGVGFAAVLTVTDSPSVRSTSGGIRFSAERTRAAVSAVPALAAELRRRSGQVPVLRLPWAVDPLPPGDWDTEVRLPLRPDAGGPVRSALSTLDPVLLLALPALRSVDADGRLLSRSTGPDGAVVLRDGAASSRWVVRSARGRVDIYGCGHAVIMAKTCIYIQTLANLDL